MQFESLVATVQAGGGDNPTILLGTFSSGLES